MAGLTPIGLATLIVAVVSLAGMIAAMVRNSRKFRGYQDIVGDAKAISKAIKGELFRDGNDLVISGNFKNLPTIVRISHDENTPGLSIEMKVPARFAFSVTPRRSSVIPKGSAVNIPSLSTNFEARTDSAFEANQLVSTNAVKKALSTICISQKVFLEITPGRLVINELLIPANLKARVAEELESVSTICTELEKFPGADVRKIVAIRHDKTSWVFRGALAAGVIITIVGIAQNAVNASDKPKTPVATPSSTTIPTNDAILIANLRDWREAEPSDFDPSFINWVRGYGGKPSSQVHFSSDSSRLQDGKAYFLVNQQGQKRVAVIVNHRLAFDAVFDSASGIAVVPMDSVSKVQWPMSKAPAAKLDGDGLLIVRDAANSNGASLLFFAPDKMYSGSPEHFESLDIQ